LNPGAELGQRIAGIIQLKAPPNGLGFSDGLLQTGDHQLFLRPEMAIHRHLVRASGLGDRVHANSAEPVPAEQLAGCADNALPRPLPNDAAILHDDPRKYFVPMP
jgi:hypothetical protein